MMKLPFPASYGCRLSPVPSSLAVSCFGWKPPGVMVRAPGPRRKVPSVRPFGGRSLFFRVTPPETKMQPENNDDENLQEATFHRALRPYYRLLLVVNCLAKVDEGKNDVVELASGSPLPGVKQLGEPIRIPKASVDILKDQVFGFDTFFATSQEPTSIAEDGLPGALVTIGVLAMHEINHILSAKSMGAKFRVPYFVPSCQPSCLLEIYLKRELIYLSTSGYMGMVRTSDKRYK